MEGSTCQIAERICAVQPLKTVGRNHVNAPGFRALDLLFRNKRLTIGVVRRIGRAGIIAPEPAGHFLEHHATRRDYFEHERERRSQSLVMARITRMAMGFTVLTLPAGLLFFFGIINVDAIPELHVLFPFGVIALGMFFISRALDAQLAPHDIEQRAAQQSPNSTRQSEDNVKSRSHSQSSAMAR